jgi:hypothetical protein
MNVSAEVKRCPCSQSIFIVENLLQYIFLKKYSMFTPSYVASKTEQWEKE